MEDLVTGADGVARCGWAGDDLLYRAYHDDEWGRPLRGDDAVLELLTLEGFQAGLAWITILRKRAAFREAFAGFRTERVAAFGPEDVDLLLQDQAIVRHRGKIEATIANARAALALPSGLSELVWSFAPRTHHPRPATLAELPAATPASTALSKELKRLGFRFVGPTTVYAFMQAAGIVDDHLAGCFAVTRGSASGGRDDARSTSGLPIAEFGFPGPLRDRLVEAILRGEKTATTGLLEEIVRTEETVGRPGDRELVVDSKGTGVAVIETTSVEVKRMDEVDLAFAVDEGEGFATVRDWHDAHVRFFTGPEMVVELGDPPVPIDGSTLVVCYRFEVVEPT